MLSHFSHVQLCATPWTVAHQAPLSMGFFRQEYVLPCPSLGELPDLGIEPASFKSLALADRYFTNIATRVDTHKYFWGIKERVSIHFFPLQES